MLIVLDTDIISIMIHSIASSLFISFLHDISRKISHSRVWILIVSWWRHDMENFPLYTGFCVEIHQSLVDSRHKRPVTVTLDVFFVVNQSKL